MEPDYLAMMIRLSLIWLVLSCLFLLYRRHFFSIDKTRLLGVFSRLIASWLSLFFLYTYFSATISSALIPIFSYSLNHIQSEYSATLSMIDASDSALQIGITTLKETPPFVLGTRYYQFFNPTSIFQGLSLVSALLIAWPVDTFKARIILLLTSFPLSFIILMLNIPFQMASSLDSTFFLLARINDLIRPQPTYQPWVLFIANGGNYILVIILVVLATQFQKRLFT